MPEPSQFDLFAPRAAAGPRVLSVGELTREIKGQLEERYARVAVQGEISNLSRPASGHVYFTLKDAEATLSAVLFKNQARLLRFELQPGQQVVAKGRITLYEPRGQYQLACDSLEPTGLGALAVAFEQLKGRLAAEGLFSPERKRTIPYLPRRIGVVTSPSGAAIRDFLRVLHHRFPRLPVLIAAARVQGEGAALEVVEGMRKLVAWSERQPPEKRLDVILLTRGGGSLEDLWAFNEEPLARAIAACPIPVVSAVGHEVDFTIADFVADLRCPTPTAAAERLAPELFKEQEGLAVRRRRLHKAVERASAHARHELLSLRQHLGDPRRRLANERIALDHRVDALERVLRRQVGGGRVRIAEAKERLFRTHPREHLVLHERQARVLREKLIARMEHEIDQARVRLQRLRERLVAQSPDVAIQRTHRLLAEQAGRMSHAQCEIMAAHRRRFSTQQARLDALSPLKVMARGYSIAFDGQGRVVRSGEDVRPGDALSVRLPDQSELSAEVKNVRPPRVE